MSNQLTVDSADFRFGSKMSFELELGG